MRKPEWMGYLDALGIAPPMIQGWALIPAVGWFECVLGLLVLAVPVPPLLVFAFGWKVVTELLRPLTGEPFWEFFERGGSYAAPLALLVLPAWARSLRPGGI
jgi:hypothetical protein